MKTLSISVDDAIFDATVEALCLKGNWRQVGDLENGDKVEFAKGILLDYMGECIHNMEMQKVQDLLQQQQQAAQEQILAANAAARQAVVMKVE
jgi:hypothetical protein